MAYILRIVLEKLGIIGEGNRRPLSSSLPSAFDKKTLSQDPDIAGESTLSTQHGSSSCELDGSGKNSNSSSLCNITNDYADLPISRRVWHNDHWDEIEEESEDEVDWINDYVGSPKDNMTNKQLYEEKATQGWLQTLSRLRRDGILALVQDHAAQPCRIPLFKDDGGDEYQINLRLSTSLPVAICTRFQDSARLLATSPFYLRGRKPFLPIERQRTTQALAIPQYVIQLGSLDVSTASRHPQYISTKDYITERTDYDVVIGIDNEEMPLWLVASRRRLKQRAEGLGYMDPIPPLPIFNGLMGDLDVSYDTACILPSIHRLGTREPDEQKTNFQLACELVHKTREVIDLVAIQAPTDNLDRF